MKYFLFKDTPDKAEWEKLLWWFQVKYAARFPKIFWCFPWKKKKKKSSFWKGICDILLQIIVLKTTKTKHISTVSPLEIKSYATNENTDLLNIPESEL